MANYNLFDAASLAMVPVGYKAGKLYSVKPDTGAGDFDFSRASYATRVNADGLIEKERANFLLQSNSFSNSSWLKTGSPIFTSGQSDPFGNNNAWKFESSNAVSTQIYQSALFNTGSIYAKAGNVSSFSIWANLNVTFDLSSGTITSGAANGTIEAVGNDGWYRCTIFNPTANVFNPNFTATAAGEFVYIAFSQAEQGLVATEYIETTTAPVYKGVTDNIPRIDYTSGCGSLLLEPQRSNIVPHSEYFNGSGWVYGNASVTDNIIESPQGIVNAAKIVENTTSNGHTIYFPLSVTLGASYTFSVFAKAAERNKIWIDFFGGANLAVFDLTDGSVLSQAGTGLVADSEDYGNGWYRLYITQNAVDPTLYPNFGPTTSSTTNNAYSGDGTSGIYVYGAQLEAGSYPTSYIPTYGSSVTRVGDLSYKFGISELIGQTEGTLFFDWIMNHESPNTSEDLYTLTMSDGTGDKVIGVNNYNNTLAVFIKDTTTQFFDNSYTGGADGERIKLALAYANNDVALYVNGMQIATDSSATIPTLSQVRLNTFWNGNLPDSSSVNQLFLFKSRLTNNELAALTRPYDTYQEWVDGEGLTWESKTCTTQSILELQNL